MGVNDVWCRWNGTLRQCWVIGPDLIEQIQIYLFSFQEWYPNNSISRPNTALRPREIR